VQILRTKHVVRVWCRCRVVRVLGHVTRCVLMPPTGTCSYLVVMWSRHSAQPTPYMSVSHCTLCLSLLHEYIWVSKARFTLVLVRVQVAVYTVHRYSKHEFACILCISRSQQYGLCMSRSYLEIQAAFCVQFLFFHHENNKRRMLGNFDVNLCLTVQALLLWHT